MELSLMKNISVMWLNDNLQHEDFYLKTNNLDYVRVQNTKHTSSLNA